jgi:ketosteroid isomerase-like protein
VVALVERIAVAEASLHRQQFDGAQRAGDSARVSRDDVEVVRAGFEAYAERGLDGLAEFWHPEINWRAMEGAPDDVGEMHGPAAMRRYAGEWVEMFDDLSWVARVLRDLGEGRVLAQVEMAGRAKLSGAATQLEYSAVCTVRDGKVVRGREYATVSEALTAAHGQPPRTNLEIVRWLVDAGGDSGASLPYLDAELEWVPRRAKTEGAYHGHEGFERFVTDTFDNFEIFEPQFELGDLSGGGVLASGVLHVIAKGSGVEMDVPVGGLFELRDGKVTRWEDFGSKEHALDAAGVPG